MDYVEESQLELLRLNVLRLQLTLAGEAVVFLTRQEALKAELAKAQLLVGAMELSADAE